MINPGTLPVDGASEDVAAANLSAFLAAVRARAGEMTDHVAGFGGEPVRVPEADRDGRYGWDLPYPGGPVVRLLMPGAPLALVRDASAAAPCVYVAGDPWWWDNAVAMAIPRTR